jgi:hypothetical protein
MIDPPENPALTQLAPTPAAIAPPRPGDPLPGPAGPELPAGRTSPAPAAGRELARPYAALALARMAEMIGDPDPKVAFPACREVLDRAWGKAEAASRAPGEEGGPVVVVVRSLDGDA